MKYQFKSVTGMEATVEASDEKEARKAAMHDIWDVQRCSFNNCIPSNEGRGLDLVSVKE